MTIDSDSARFSRALKKAILLPAGVILLTALLLLALSLELFHMVTLTDHSAQVIETTGQCEKMMLDLETGVRGYLLGGDAEFRKPYDQSIGEIDHEFDKLKELVHDNPEQVIRADDLIKARNLWIEHAKGSLSQKEAGQMPSDEWRRIGMAMMDDVRAKFDRFTAVEKGLQSERRGEVRRLKQALGFAGVGLVLILVLTVGRAVQRQFSVLAGGYREALATIEQRHAALARSEADLEEQKEWFRVTLSSIGDGVIVTNLEGKVVFMNHEAERLTGWMSRDALMQPLTTVFRIVNEQTRVTVDDPVGKVLREKKVVGLANHTVLLSRLGAEWPIEDSAAPISNAQGQILGVVLVFHNATEMRQTQNAMRAYSHDLERKVAERTTSLQQAFSELEAFSYTVSHDLRSPLRAMRGFSEAVLEDYGDKLDEQGKDYLERITNAAGRLDRLIQDLLSFTRLSQQDASLVPVDLDRVVHGIIQDYPNFHSEGVEVKVEGTLPKVMGTEAIVTQIISNLLGNAVKFVPAGVAPRVRVWSENRGPNVRLWVEDNGIGIDPENFERIFQMFVQVNESQHYKGTGIGLAIVKKAAQALHGSVGLDSKLQKGSRFWVELARA